MPQSWKISLPCTKAEAEALQDDISPLAMLDEPPVLMTSEEDESAPDQWRLDAYFSEEPSRRMIDLLRSLVPSARSAEPAIVPVEEQDWVTLSQSGLEPIRAGRFFVHTPAHRDSAPADAGRDRDRRRPRLRHRPARDHDRLPALLCAG
jgi:ribosomal protein L11 methyltransferase